MENSPDASPAVIGPPEEPERPTLPTEIWDDIFSWLEVVGSRKEARETIVSFMATNRTFHSIGQTTLWSDVNINAFCSWDPGPIALARRILDAGRRLKTFHLIRTLRLNSFLVWHDVLTDLLAEMGPDIVHLEINYLEGSALDNIWPFVERMKLRTLNAVVITDPRIPSGFRFPTTLKKLGCRINAMPPSLLEAIEEAEGLVNWETGLFDSSWNLERYPTAAAKLRTAECYQEHLAELCQLCGPSLECLEVRDWTRVGEPCTTAVSWRDVTAFIAIMSLQISGQSTSVLFSQSNLAGIERMPKGMSLILWYPHFDLHPTHWEHAKTAIISSTISSIAINKSSLTSGQVSEMGFWRSVPKVETILSDDVLMNLAMEGETETEEAIEEEGYV
jgi:hypothetical protein